MPAEVKILVEGTTNADDIGEAGEEHTQPTVTLVRDGDIVMVVDPGILESQQILVDAFKKAGLTVGDVNLVCVTHSHLDHYRNVGMFSDAKTLDYWGLWSGNKIKSWSENFSDNIKIFHTPGHDYTSITVFVKTEEGVVAMCGDVFWKEGYPHSPHDDAFASNPERLIESRSQVLKMADWIVPGHGPMYKNVVKEEPMANAKGRPKETKITVICKNCGAEMKQREKCQCRPYLCYRCCECGLDCMACSCSHRK
jgi:glyoxylase-like metal-dependent hydrolase (beta-lactamase superfamily II)